MATTANGGTEPGLQPDPFHLFGGSLRKRWAARPVPYLHLKSVSELHGLPESLALMLARRGYSGMKLEDFLNPDIQDMSSWRNLGGILEAAERIVTAVVNSEKILVHGDFDADGITATAVVYMALSRLGAEISYFVPDRFIEGYGIGSSAVQLCADNGIDLLITVDCGITANEQINELNGMNTDTVITDHHQSGDQLPFAKAIVNPALDGDAQHSTLAGVGVAWMVMNGVYELMNAETSSLHELLQLVAIGTVTDVVDLINDNRILVSEGLKLIRRKPLPGISALAKSASVNLEDCDSSHLAFYIGPRLNACGRVGHAKQAVALLLAMNESEAEELLAPVEENNRIRKKFEQDVEKQVKELTVKLQDPRCIVLAGEGWHRGVVGIVASRLVSRYGVPVILISLEADLGHGSARSIPGISIHSLLGEIQDEYKILNSFGGHPMAAGLTIQVDNVQLLKEHLETLLSEQKWDEYIGSVLYLDGSLDEKDFSIETVHALSRLEPFGSGNSMPVWLARECYAIQWRAVGKNRNHLSCDFKIGSNIFKAIGFNMVEKQSLLGGRVDLAFALSIDTWRNDGSVQLILKDVRKSVKRNS